MTWGKWSIVVAVATITLLGVLRAMRLGLHQQDSPGPKSRSRIWDFIVDYWINIVSVGGATAAVIANVFNPDQNLAIPAVFALLTIIAFDSIIRDHKFNRPFQWKLEQLLAESRGNACLDDRYVDQIPFEEELGRAVTIEIVANTMQRTLSSHSGAFVDFLQRGGTLRSVMMDAGGDQSALKMAAARTSDTVESFQYKVQLSLNQLNAIKSRATAGTIETRLCMIAPSFGLYVFNRERPDAKAYLRLFAHYIELDRNPTFELSKAHEPRTFGMFCDQFDLIWSHARAIDVHPTVAISTPGSNS